MDRSKSVMYPLTGSKSMSTGHHFCGILEKDAYPEFNHEETSDKPKLKELLQNNCPPP